ncbi:uncharacterized protein [Musca autumnalis]|uniref:uncharacterized protein n=1 Tax=Musca autumnalis TaxID=221902 RepID=UPI003CF8D08B
MTKNFYDSCMESQEFDPMEFMHWLENKEKMTWALLTPLDTKGVVFDWPSTMAIFRKYGFNDMLVDQWDKPTINYQFLNEKDMVDLAQSMTLPYGTMNFEQIWKYIDELEDKFLEIQVKKPKEEIYKFKELPYEWLKKYVRALMGGQLDPNMELSMKNVVAMKELNEVLVEYQDYFLCIYLEVRFLKYLERANKRDTPNACMEQTASLLTPATEWIHSQLHPELVQEIPEMQQIFGDVVKNLQKTLRMGQEEGIIPQEFFRKLETVRLQVGNFPSSANTMASLESYYKNLQLHANDYYGNYMEILKFHFELEPKDKDMFFNTRTYTMPSWDDTPFYDLDKNVYVLPFAVLRPPIYHVAYENIFKQSALATIMALRLFEDFELLGDGTDKIDTLNLTYLASFSSSFEIFFSSLQDKEAKRYLSMFEMTSLQELKQMFFINAVHYLCEKDDDEAEVVNYMLMDLSEFNSAFDCKFNRVFKKF